MPTSIDPQPGEDELECARCGAYFYYELTRCPNCGVNVYGPKDEDDERQQTGSGSLRSFPAGRIARLRAAVGRILGEPHPADQLFSVAQLQADLYNDLLGKVGGDHEAAHRLIEHERGFVPEGHRTLWLKNAIQSWLRDNRPP